MTTPTQWELEIAYYNAYYRSLCIAHHQPLGRCNPCAVDEAEALLAQLEKGSPR